MRRWAAAFLSAAPMAAFHFTWLGAPIWLLGLGIAIGVVLFASIAWDADPRGLGAAASRYGIALGAELIVIGGLAPDAVLSASMHRTAWVIVRMSVCTAPVGE